MGLALVSAAAGAAVLNAFADLLTAWWQDPGSRPPVRVRDEGDCVLAEVEDPPALLELRGDLAATALAQGQARGEAPISPVPGARRAPVEVHLSLGARCPLPCQGCYLDAGPGAVAAPSPHEVDALLARLGEVGVFQVALGGGELALRDDLVERLRAARRAGLVPNLTLTGFGLNDQRARELAGLVGQVNLSLDALDTTEVRGWNAAPVALNALRSLRRAGVPCGVNTVVTRANLDELPALAERLLEFGVEDWQWLRFKPAGRGAAVYDRLALLPEQQERLWPMALALEARGMRIRWDCAMAPFLAAASVPAGQAERLGSVGCVGGVSLLAADPMGRLGPCSFVQAGVETDPERAWRQDPTLLQWRARAALPPSPCAGCDWQEICRGGCRAVAAHLTGDALAPDPECPRVRGAA